MVSVIIPYNKDRGYLKYAIASVWEQTYTDWEIIEACSPGNCATNINTGLLKAGGDYVKILAEDDLLTPDSLEILVEGIRGYDFVYSDGEFFGQLDGWADRSYDKTVTLESMLKGNGINGGAVLYRTQMLRDVGGWDESLWTAEEYDLHLKLISKGYKHRHIPGIVHRYRRHNLNKSVTERKGRHELINQIRKRYV